MRILRSIRFVISLKLLAVLMAAVFLAGCPKNLPAPSESQIAKAAKSSKMVADYTGEVIATVKRLYEAGVIKLELKDKVAAILKDFSVKGKEFNDLVAQLRQQYKDGQLPASAWSDLTGRFDSLTKLFTDILGFIPQLAGLKDSKAFKTITAAVVTLAQLFMTVGHLTPAWKNIERAVPNWRELIGPGSLYQREVLDGLA
jgi:hypothetical protein